MFVFEAHKPGTEAADRDKVQQTTINLSKHSEYYKTHKQRLDALHERLTRAMQRPVPPSNLARHAAAAEANRVLYRMWVHVDMDMFYAAVAIRDNPALGGNPVAVGDQHMISTANYEARAFGVRSAMPGFIAKALCPQLIFVPIEFEKYEVVAQEIRLIFAEYDPAFDAIGLDEASLDVTEYAQKRFGVDLEDPEMFVEIGAQIAQEIRDAIFKLTQLTSSAGVACNYMLAKICSDVNKPNGQMILKNCKPDIL
jgi:DNA polymerase kappa